MNKREAKQKAESGEITIGELRALVTARRERGGMSKVNPAFTIADSIKSVIEKGKLVSTGEYDFAQGLH